jgi:molybdate transport system substrate-binding protein
MVQPTPGRKDVISGTDFNLCAVCHVTSKDPQAKACATGLRRLGAVSTSGVPTDCASGLFRKKSWLATTLITFLCTISPLAGRVADTRPAASAENSFGRDAAVTGTQRPCGVVTIAAAADLIYSMNELIGQFEKASGCTARLSAGSSGNFFSQIENGAPFDVFFSADVDYPRKLEAEGLAVPGSVFVYGIGKIVVWVRTDSRLDLSKGLAALRDPSVRKVAIANPQHAPYGRAAEEALRKAGVYDAVKDRLVLGENISQAAQFVESGNADAGILALSLAVSPGLKEEGRYSKIPENLYTPIEQGAALLHASPNPQPARAFLEFVKTPGAAAVLERYGFTVPGSKGKGAKKP